ncbi:MAG: heptaprenyl diphosphate synthase component 1 [Firmicutes bacterium]|nr:heptaprenyl diphosphate synthase component 1 [Bacillota bacterium]
MQTPHPELRLSAPLLSPWSFPADHPPDGRLLAIAQLHALAATIDKRRASVLVSAVVLLQSGLETHFSIVAKTPVDRAKQFAVLEGDSYSSGYYWVLAKHSEWAALASLSRTVCAVEETRTNWLLTATQGSGKQLFPPPLWRLYGLVWQRVWPYLSIAKEPRFLLAAALMVYAWQREAAFTPSYNSLTRQEGAMAQLYRWAARVEEQHRDDVAWVGAIHRLG